MGDRYTFYPDCIYCNHTNEEVWYAPTCGVYTFKCEKCKKTNFITSDFTIKKIEDVTLQDIKDAFLMATSIDWDEEDIDRMCKETLKNYLRLPE